MKKSMLLTMLSVGLSMHSVPAYAFADLGINATPPQPQTKRGKFKRRNKGRKK